MNNISIDRVFRRRLESGLGSDITDEKTLFTKCKFILTIIKCRFTLCQLYYNNYVVLCYNNYIFIGFKTAPV